MFDGKALQFGCFIHALFRINRETTTLEGKFTGLRLHNNG
jgi:hypothetical protein